MCFTLALYFFAFPYHRDCYYLAHVPHKHHTVTILHLYFWSAVGTVTTLVLYCPIDHVREYMVRNIVLQVNIPQATMYKYYREVHDEGSSPWLQAC